MMTMQHWQPKKKLLAVAVQCMGQMLLRMSHMMQL
jgi:hypothetical protein